MQLSVLPAMAALAATCLSAVAGGSDWSRCEGSSVEDGRRVQSKSIRVHHDGTTGHRLGAPPRLRPASRPLVLPARPTPVRAPASEWLLVDSRQPARVGSAAYNRGL